jgi:hypothetical protein
MDGCQGSGTTPFPELHCALNEKEKQMMLQVEHGNVVQGVEEEGECEGLTAGGSRAA